MFYCSDTELLYNNKNNNNNNQEPTTPVPGLCNGIFKNQDVFKRVLKLMIRFGLHE